MKSGGNMKKTVNFLFVIFILSGWFSARAAEPERLESTINLAKTYLLEMIDYYNLPGLAIGVVNDQDLIWSEGFGYADLKKKKPFLPEMLFRVASITKLFTSTAILQLRDEGKLDLDDPISKYLPYVKFKNPYSDAGEPTIRQTLSHISGMPREAAFPYWTDQHFPDLEEIKTHLHEQRMIYEPETEWKYSNLAMALLGEIVHVVSGKDYETYIREKIFSPLNMQNSGFELNPEIKKKLVRGYYRYLGKRKRKVVDIVDFRGLIPAAGLYTNIPDLAKFCSFQFNEKTDVNLPLKGHTLQEMHRPHWINKNWKSGWGWGFWVKHTDEGELIGHAGWVAGYRSQILLSPERKLGVIVFINTEDFSPYQIAEEILNLFLKFYQENKLAEKVQPSTWSSYFGVYMDPFFWRTDVLEYNGVLYFYDYNYPPEKNILDNLIELVPVEGDTFRMTGLNGNGDFVIFEKNEKGEVIQIKRGENYTYPVKK